MAGVTTFSVLWACFAKLDEAVSAAGQLEPQGSVKEIQVPLNGVVKEVFVKDGQRVKQGEVLLTLDRTAADSQLTSLKKIRSALVAENRFYQSETGDVGSSELGAAFKPAPELAALTKSRSALAAENALYRAQLSGSVDTPLSPEQRLRLQSSLAEQTSREQAAELDVGQSERQLAQARSQLVNAKAVFKVNQGIFAKLETVYKEGSIPEVQYLRQQQEVLNSQARVEQLTEEAKRLTLAIAQSRQKLQNTIALSSQDLLAKIADNEKKIAEIDSQLKKAIVENEKKIAEIDSQISQSQVTLQYQELRAPVDGIVFDLKAGSPGFVATSTEPVLKVVPDDALLVEVFIPNKDIGFVKEGMPVDIRIDSFPFSEFGDIKGQVVTIGSDALPPTQIRQFYSFPAKIRLDRQFLTVRDRQVPLQSGMSVSVNIKVRDRTIINIFTDGFMQQVDSFKSVR
ncbi:HlyD family efflux transporter periplasmic adaptor subunit [Leptolyngbya sp. FACHB-36]|nr:HlyD family efflux transporter periplasmic adaptor subunit [Leptolyngbya sp. FACHB-36]